MSESLLRFCKMVDKHFWANCESFNFENGYLIVPRFMDGGMDGEAGFIQQIETVRPYAEKIMTFMLSGLFNPPGLFPCPGGEKTINQYCTYAEYFNTRAAKGGQP